MHVLPSEVPPAWLLLSTILGIPHARYLHVTIVDYSRAPDSGTREERLSSFHDWQGAGASVPPVHLPARKRGDQVSRSKLAT